MVLITTKTQNQKQKQKQQKQSQNQKQELADQNKENTRPENEHPPQPGRLSTQHSQAMQRCRMLRMATSMGKRQVHVLKARLLQTKKARSMPLPPRYQR